MISFCYRLQGLIAQWIEHPPSKRVVVGSNPTQSEILYQLGHNSGVSSMESIPALGEWKLTPYSFPNLQAAFTEFLLPEFKKLSARKRFGRINQTLLDFILEAPEPAFLFPAVIEYIDRVNREHLLPDPLRFVLFEFWLNHSSRVTDEQNARVRAKIVGKWIPREAYQVFFPIGMNAYFPGTHFVSAHMSPDVDTMIASFWGWVDAFGARVGTGQHMWSLPGGPPDSPVTIIFQEIFGQSVFFITARASLTLTLSAIDLVSQKNFRKEKAATSISTLDHGSNERAVILVDDQDHYLGDWRSTDVELVRQIVILFKACLRWFENRLHTLLITLFAKEEVRIQDVDAFLKEITSTSVGMSDPAQDFSEEQKKLLNDLITKVFDIPKGMHSTFYEMIIAMKERIGHDVSSVFEKLAALRTSGLFDSDGLLIESRPSIFRLLETIFQQLNMAIYTICNYVERLDVVMRIKTAVLETPMQYLTMRTDVEEIRLKLKNEDYLTVVIPEENGKLFPLGVVWAKDLRKTELGTISFRDFCNQEEVKMASYISVISVIDHHKTALKTDSPPLALIGDVQSCNVLVAEQTIRLNERFSLEGMDAKGIHHQLEEHKNSHLSPSDLRISQRLLQRQMVCQAGQEFYIHPQREFIEYLTFLHAILDDTDLLTKVSNRDVECVVHLLNRMKSIQLKQEVEIVHVDDIPRDRYFARKAAKRILQNSDMFSLYQKSYALREKEVENNLRKCVQGLPSTIFVDTKEQNGCCRVGQTKMFSANIPTFKHAANFLRRQWVKTAQEVYQENMEVDLHMHMITTIATAKEVYSDLTETFNHQDEIWFWIPSTQQAQNHLAIFLSAFQSTPAVQNNEMHLELLSSGMEEVRQIFVRNFLALPLTKTEYAEGDIPIAILHFKAGSINSRKSMITPYLPRLLP